MKSQNCCKSFSLILATKSRIWSKKFRRRWMWSMNLKNKWMSCSHDMIRKTLCGKESSHSSRSKKRICRKLWTRTKQSLKSLSSNFKEISPAARKRFLPTNSWMQRIRSIRSNWESWKMRIRRWSMRKIRRFSLSSRDWRACRSNMKLWTETKWVMLLETRRELLS